MSRKDNDMILRTGNAPAAPDLEAPEERELQNYGPLGYFLKGYNAYPSSYITQIVRDVIVYEDNLEEVVKYHREQNKGNPSAKNVKLIRVTNPDTGKEYAAIQIGELIITTPREVVTAIKKDENGETVFDEYGRPVLEMHNKEGANEDRRGIDAVRLYDFFGRKFLEETAKVNWIMRQDVTYFPARELVEAKIYSRTSAAVRGVIDARGYLKGFGLSGKYETKDKGKSKTYPLPTGVNPLFQVIDVYSRGQEMPKKPDDRGETEQDTRESMIWVERMSSFPWDDTTEQFQLPEPEWIFDITGAPYLLAHEIFYRARVNASKTNRPDRRMNFRTARFILKLPSPESRTGKSHPKDKIKTPIIEAVATIQANFKLHRYHGITLSVRYDEGYDLDSPIGDFLDHGYILIVEHGEYKDTMKEIYSKRGKYFAHRRPKSPKGVSGKAPELPAGGTEAD